MAYGKNRPGRGDARRRAQTEWNANKPRRLERAGPGATRHDPVHLEDDVVRELKRTARPGKGEILVKVFADAAAAYGGDDLGEAIELAGQAKHIALRSATVRELLGLALYRAGRYKEAASELTAFRRLSGATDQNPVIADSYRAQGRPEKALEFCDEIELGSASSAVWFEGQIVAAGALSDMGRVDDAAERLQGLDLRPRVALEHHLRAWYALANLLERQGRFSQAREWFEAVESADPDLTDASERLKRLR